MFLIDQVTLNREKLLTRKKSKYMKHFKRIQNLNRATLVKINYEKCMTTSTIN